ncbi:3D domain-containing protein [Psychrobacillus sp. OK032]|uniref:3D domain-containing protein n=1 Tax=Psychrobacillus sp. OK032 TaxID=1884358 RepID=UPI000AF5792B|nr:3D domain-containing protein [Psychrobacillus sp. OK032]
MAPTPEFTYYPALDDAELTHNVHARQASLAAALDKRKANEIKAEQVAVKETPKQAPQQPSRSASPRRETIAYEATAYVALCDSGCTGITKTGVDVRHTIYYESYRVIAVDPRQFPLGSIVRVTLGDGTTFKAIASDTGGDIKGFRIDVLVATESEAWEFGRQTVGIEIVRRGVD